MSAKLPAGAVIHRIGTMSFRRGFVDCRTCGEKVTNAGTPEILAAAWLDHTNGRPMGRTKPRDKAFIVRVNPKVLSATERGRMGAAAKRAKRAERDSGLAPG